VSVLVCMCVCVCVCEYVCMYVTTHAIFKQQVILGVFKSKATPISKLCMLTS
jgi:hypothetical protein